MSGPPGSPWRPDAAPGAGGDDWLALADVLAEERRALRGDAAPVDGLADEQAHRIDAATPWRALCLSGGGLRAAVFSLGVTQGLAERGRLHRFDYLSTVSGGGYTGGALSAYAARLRAESGGTTGAGAAPGTAVASDAPMAGVAERIARADGPGGAFVAHLREYASYLTPRLGALSPDLTSMLVLTVRNLAIVWLVLLPVLTMLMLGPQYVAMVLHEKAAGYFTGGSLAPGFGIAAVGLFAWCMVLPELATAGRWPWLGTRGALYALLILPLAGAALLGLIAGFDVPPPDPTAVAAPAPGWDSLVDWLGPLFAWVPAVAIGVATVRVVLRRLLRGRCGIAALARLWVGAAIGSALTAVIALALLEPEVGRWLAARRCEPVPGPLTGERLIVATMLAPPVLLSLWWVFDVILVGIASGRDDDLDREHMASVTAATLLPAAGWLLWCALSFGRPQWLFDIGTWGLPEAWRPWVVPALVLGCVGVLAVVGLRWLSAPLRDLSPEGDDGRRVLRDARIAGAAGLLLIVIVVRGVADSGAAWLELGDRAAARAGHFGGSPTGREERQDLDDAPTDAEAKDHARRCAELAARTGAMAYGVSRQDAPDRWLELILVCAAWAAVAGTLVQVNRFSMHEIYRTRVARTFLGASRATTGDGRRPDPLTGFDARDDLPMSALRGLRPMLVINTALNRSNSASLRGQERRALPFSISPLHAGAADPGVGYRRTARYARLARMERHAATGGGGLRVGAAVALSGAATSPSMGYGTQGIASFVLTLFNVRLGLWLGNPRSERAWARSEPPHSVVPLLRDLIADTDDAHRWINLTDGGHFDNLGVYEMLQRRCRLIVCVDATNDGRRDLHHLARVVRMASVDLHVEIHALPVDDPSPQPSILAYRVGWPDGAADSEGLLLVVKPTLCGDEPVDVAQYAQAYPEFPHESTTDQFFGEGQFECYRRLGRLSADRLVDFIDGALRAHPWAVELVERAWRG